MLIEYIERLRKEPPDVRRQAVFLWTGVIVALIVLIYIAVLIVRNTLPDREGTNPTIAAPYEAQ